MSDRQRRGSRAGVPPQVREWRDRLLATVLGLLVFETLTGLAIWLAPFGVTTQVAVVLHTVAGLVFILPYAWYQLRHWRRLRRALFTHVKLTGYLSMVATVVCGVSGLVLTWQAVFGTGIGYGWETTHIVSTLAVIATAVPHVLAKILQNRRARGEAGAALRRAQGILGRRTAWIGGGLTALVALVALTQAPADPHAAFPDGYEYPFGPDRPFAPSLAETSTGGAIEPDALGRSATCGAAGCHEQIFEEWRPSAHRYAAMDTAFLAVQAVMAKQNGPETTRYCAGCHDPISLFAGAKRVSPEHLTIPQGRDEGVSCVVCHAIKETDVKGNASYVLAPPERYLYEVNDGPAARFVSNFLIRAYPEKHVETLSHEMFKSPEFCGACHKQFVDEEVNQVGWVQLQNQYDSWRKSRWNHPGDPTRTVECRECHMRLVGSRDPAAGDERDYNRTPQDGRHRSHRFLAANQWMPVALGLEGGQEHARMVEEWLRGDIPVPEIEDKWARGPAVPLELLVPESVRPGERVSVRAVFTNNKAGHNFPTGPLDIIQAWVELTVRGPDGQVIYRSGGLDEDLYLEQGSFVFKAVPVDREGEIIDHHNLWELVGIRSARKLYPGVSDQAEFTFYCPALGGFAADAGGAAQGESTEERFEFRAPAGATELRVSARLLYRKSSQKFLDFVLGEGSGITTPITVLDTADAVIPVVPGRRSADGE